MTTQLIPFEPQEASDGQVWIRADDVKRITKAPNRRSAARIFFFADGREEYFDTRSTPQEAAEAVNAALADE